MTANFRAQSTNQYFTFLVYIQGDGHLRAIWILTENLMLRRDGISFSERGWDVQCTLTQYSFVMGY